jgi:hypothetical protein
LRGVAGASAQQQGRREQDRTDQSGASREGHGA